MTTDHNLQLISDDIIVYAEDEPAQSCEPNCTAVTWIKISFIFICFAEGIISGMIPTWSKSCRSNPKILGIANAFAAGVFMAIALVHVLPEEIEGWATYIGGEKVFPLPEVLAFAGYTLILILDKVLFDSHALFDDPGHNHAHDPADAKFEQAVRESFSKQRDLPVNATPEQVRESQVEAKTSME
jgi:zinc transporter ZupT